MCQGLKYSRAFLLSCSAAGNLTFDPKRVTVQETWQLVRRRTKRGRRGGIRERARRRRCKPALPSIMLVNAQSVCNKFDELETCARYLHQFREACLICLTETWLSGKDSDPNIPGFSLIRMDRSREATKKKTGGGVCVYVNERWCKNVTIKEEHCCTNIELLTVALRPFYLPREFRQIFVTVVYVHPKADMKVAADIIRQAVQKQETQCPESVRLIMGDMNTCRLSKHLPNYRQYVTCKTCGDNTLDQCFGNIPGAYRSSTLPGLGRSVHYAVHLLPRYRQRLKSSKPTSRRIRVWTKEAVEALDGCFHCTDWDVLLDACSSLDEQVDTVTAYLHFCVDLLVPIKEVKIYPNGKPWVTKEVAEILRKRQQAFREGKKEEVKRLQKESRRRIVDNKKKFQCRVEDNFRNNNSRQVWKSLQTMTDYKPGKRSLIPEDAQKLAEELNAFYARFDQADFSEEQAAVLGELSGREEERVILSVGEVSACFKKVNPRSACGPDGVLGTVLKHCHSSLAPVFTTLFQSSLDSSHIPLVWKSSDIVPVPKKPSPSVMNDYRPVALTSVPFKCLERLVLRRLLAATGPHQDPMQFAYAPNRSTEDAVLTMLHAVLKHLDRPKTYSRILFVDFSSAFNTIQPHLMAEKLMKMEVNPVIIRWVHSFLTGRPQRVRIGLSMSAVLHTNTGAPQGCVTSPALFTIYTADCRCSSDAVQVKFSDDTSVTGLISTDEGPYRAAVDDLVRWCDRNFLHLNVAKTKELVVDFRRDHPAPAPLVIKGEEVEIVPQYKYLGTIIDQKLDWTDQATAMLKRGNQRLFFLKKLKAFRVCPRLLELFYRATVESVLTFNSLSFFGGMKEHDKDRLKKITKTACKLIGSRVPDLQSLFEAKAVSRLKAIRGDHAHPLCKELASSARSGRLLSLRTRTDRFRLSFLPTAVRLTNAAP